MSDSLSSNGQTPDDDAERKVALALFALDTMADEWAAETELLRQMRTLTRSDSDAEKLVALMKQCWVEGAYAGRMSQFTEPPLSAEPANER